MNFGYYDRNGERLPDNWASDQRSLDSNRTDHRIARTAIGGVEVSTCWLGFDHNHGRGPLAIFETMIFGGPHEYELDRYATEEAALRGHLETLDRLRAGKPPFPHLDGDDDE